MDKVRDLRQSDVTWLCTARRAPFWIMPKNQPPYRPYVMLVLEQDSNLIRQTQVRDERPTPDAVLEVLIKAMRGPLLGSGRRRRPARIFLDDADLVQALAPQLAAIDIRCDYRAVLPPVNAALLEMEAHATKREPIPGLLSVPGVTQPLAGELITAAADYYRQAPWRWIDNTLPIEVHYPPDSRARYAVVLGSGREVFGLSLYESREDLRRMYSGIGPEQVPSVNLVFEEATTMSFDDLDAIEKYGWPVAGEQAYPMTIKITPPGVNSVPNGSEIAWLAATLRVIPDFVINHLRADRGWPRPAQATYPLPNVHGGQRIALRYAADLLEGVEYPQDETDDAGQDLEEFIQDWYWDERSHDFARQVGAFLFQFLDDLETTGLSEATMRKHERNCWCIGKLECDYGYHDTFSPTIFLGGPGYLYEFKRKVSDSKYAVDSYEATWRKLERYVRSLGYGTR